MVNYARYIKSKKWRVKSRNFIKSIGCCQKCNGKKKLGCHHITYKNLGNETIKDIKVWCWKCHKEHHVKAGDYRGIKQKRFYIRPKKNVIVNVKLRKRFNGLTRRDISLIGRNVKLSYSNKKFKANSKYKPTKRKRKKK